jgi:outer membrane protein assembly factor BamD
MNRHTSFGYLNRMSRLSRERLAFAVAFFVIGAVAACAPTAFTPVQAATNQSLFEASLKAEKAENWSLAAKGFEQLTFQLPARDPILPLAFYHLGIAHERQDEFILAAQAYSRVPENFPEDTLAALATFRAGICYESLWKRPDLDPDYGTTAISTFQSFIAAYPDSPMHDSAQKSVDRLKDMFAKKNLETADLYAKQRAWDSSIIYYKYVVVTYPETPSLKHALLGLVKAYHAIAYRDDANDACAQLRQKFGKDGDVRSACGEAPVTDSLATKPLAPPAAPAKP